MFFSINFVKLVQRLEDQEVMDTEAVVYAHVHFKFVHASELVKFVKNEENRHFEFSGVGVCFPAGEFSGK